MNKFEDLNLSEQLMKSINRLGYKEPTQIQNDTIPLILEGSDVIGESATGSGKTLAFGAGIVEKCQVGKGVQAVVLVPTRELAEQVKDEMVTIAYGKKLKILAVYGGVSINPQIDRLRKSEVVIATPGRMLDHLSRGTIDTSKVKIFVLDEADRMVEMGFIEDVEKIIRACPKEKQTLLFSATMYGPAKQIAKRYMNNPKTVHATKMVDPSKLKQTYYNVSSRLKKELLVSLLEQEKSDLVMVFCNTRMGTEMVVDFLRAHKIKAAPIHGGLTQVKRLKTIDMFHHGKFAVLVCTDVAARGLHIEGVTHIYNFDIPKEPSDYVHRIGRTARAGNEGVVINILARRDYDSFGRLTDTHRDFNIIEEESPKLKKSEVESSRYSRRSKSNRNSSRKFGSRRETASRRSPSRGGSSRFGSGRSSRSSRSESRSRFGSGRSSSRFSESRDKKSFSGRKPKKSGDKPSEGSARKSYKARKTERHSRKTRMKAQRNARRK